MRMIHSLLVRRISGIWKLNGYDMLHKYNWGERLVSALVVLGWWDTLENGLTYGLKISEEDLFLYFIVWLARI